MHCITINFGPTGTIWTFLYRTPEAAQTALDKFSKPPMLSPIPHDQPLTMETARVMHEKPAAILGNYAGTIEDDFGQYGIITFPIHGLLFEDLDVSKLAHVERAIHNAKTQADAQKRAQSDPSLNILRNGPGVLAPSMGGFRQ